MLSSSDQAMAMTPAMIGEAFAKQYYAVLEQSPEYVYRFYTEASSLTRAEVGMHGYRHMARSPPDIRNLVMASAAGGCRAYVKTLDAQESFGGSVFLLVTGMMHKNFTSRNFVQSFFLAPQERGFYVLNDIFRYIDEESQTLNSTSAQSNGNEDTVHTMMPKRSQNNLSEAVSNHSGLPGEEKQRTVKVQDALDYRSYPGAKESGVGAKETQRQGRLMDQHVTVDNSRLATSEAVPSERLSYANILRSSRERPAFNTNQPEQQVTKAHSSPHLSHLIQLPRAQSGLQAVEEAVVADNEDEVKTVYMNLHSSITEVLLREDLRKFGAIKHGGIIIRARKEGGYYAFVEFESTTSALSAIKASPVLIGGQSTRIEPKKSTFEGGHNRGQGRGSVLRASYAVPVGNGFKKDGNGFECMRPRE